MNNKPVFAVTAPAASNIAQQALEEACEPYQTSSINAINRSKCMFCGRGPHNKDECAARRKNPVTNKMPACRQCGKEGQFVSVCMSGGRPGMSRDYPKQNNYYNKPQYRTPNDHYRKRNRSNNRSPKRRSNSNDSKRNRKNKEKHQTSTRKRSRSKRRSSIEKTSSESDSEIEPPPKRVQAINIKPEYKYLEDILSKSVLVTVL